MFKEKSHVEFTGGKDYSQRNKPMAEKKLNRISMPNLPFHSLQFSLKQLNVYFDEMGNTVAMKNVKVLAMNSAH